MRVRRKYRYAWGLLALCFLVCPGCGGDAVLNEPALKAGQVFLSRTPAGTVDTMAAVPAGEFLMGTNTGYAPEGPAHRVYLDAFYIDKYEVTTRQYRLFVESTGYPQPSEANNPLFSGDRQPVVGVAWADAQAYCRWRGGALPTEAQWEKAARGTDGRTYPWGETAPNGEYAVMDLGGYCGRSSWYNPPSGPVPGEYCQTMPVGSLPKGASPYGLLDMAGNVWDWCADWYDDNAYAGASKRNPTGPGSGTFRVVRGSSWYHLPHYLQTSARFRFQPDTRSIYVGFRCAQAVPE